jgi:hypothetical protein
VSGIRIRTCGGQADRVLIVGNARGGKTELARALLGGHPSWVVFDSKRNPREWAEWGPALGAVVSQNPADIRRHERVVFQVDTRSLQDRAGWVREGRLGSVWTEALQSVFWRQEGVDLDVATVAVFDEMMHTLPINAHPEARRMSTQGGGLGIPVWGLTQAPLWVDTVTMSQADHCFAFTMMHDGYRQELSLRRGVNCDLLRTLGGRDHPDPERRYEFAYHQLGSDAWTPMAPLEVNSEGVNPVTLSEPENSEEAVDAPDIATLQSAEEPVTEGA